MQQSNSMAAYGKRDTVQDTDANAPWKKKQATAANVSRNETLQSSPPRIAQPTAGVFSHLLSSFEICCF